MATHSLYGIMGISLTDTPTTGGVFPLGTEVLASDGATYKHVKASAAVAAYAAVKIDDDGQIAELTTALSGAEPTRVGFAQAAFASADYGWVVVSGPCTVLVSASCAADVKIGTTATAGVIDDTYTDLVQGLKLTTACGGAQAATAAYATGPCFTNHQD